MMKEHDGAPEEELRNDFDIEPEEDLGDVAAAQAKMKKLKEELAKIKKERQEYLDGWQRCKADSVNLRKDVESRAARSAEMLREALVHDIIPALDSFDLAAGSEAWATVSDGWRSGMENVRDQLVSALRNHGVERYGKVGDHFDHALYDAVEDNDDVAGEKSTVARILRYGYKSSNNVLRPAQVTVKK